MNLENILVQVFQPYFYYAIVFTVISFVCIKAITNFLPFVASRIKSLIYLIPICGPVLIMLVWAPKLVLQTVSYHLIGSFPVFAPRAPAFFSPFQYAQPTAAQSMVTLVAISTNQILSITGILCLAGLAVGGTYAATTLAFGDWIAARILGVINLSPTEYEWLQAEVAQISQKLSIRTPQIALVEDLRPNAFTLGLGRNARIVFTIGLLNVLDREEITAVASHELAHIKSRDFLFKTISNALTGISFFNPFAYLSLFNAQREREMLADENGAKLLQKPDMLASALKKITVALRNFPREGRFIRLTSNLLVTSQIIHRPQILSGHPKIDLRLRNINQLTATSPRHVKPKKLAVALILTSLIVLAGASAVFALSNVQSGYASSKITFTIPGALRVTGADYTGPNVIIVNSNLTWSATPYSITTMLNPDSHSIVAPYYGHENGQFGIGPNQASHSAFGSDPTTSSPTKIAIIYTATSQSNTTVVIKF